MKNLYFLLFVLIISACTSEKKVPESLNTQQGSAFEPAIVKQIDPSHKMAFPTIYSDGNENIILATTKESGKLISFNAETGDSISSVGESGRIAGEFWTPNELKVLDSLCFVIEKDNRRVQIFKLPELKPLGYLGKSKLIAPEGLSVIRISDLPANSTPTQKSNFIYRIYIADNYRQEDGSMPPDSSLNRRIVVYDIQFFEDDIISKFVTYMGDTKGDAKLTSVESIYADPINNNLLVCDENPDKKRSSVKVFDMYGKFKKNFGEGLFRSEPDGIALYVCTDKTGYWFIADRSSDNNEIHIFKRKNFEPLGKFNTNSIGMTDGIFIHQNKVGTHRRGQFIAVTNDGKLGIWDLGELLNELELGCE